MTTNRTPIRRQTKQRITPEAVAAYKRARAIYNMPPQAREHRQREYLDACLDMEQALRRQPWDYDVMDTIDNEAPPGFVVHDNVADWQQTVEIRRELERLAKGL